MFTRVLSRQRDARLSTLPVREGTGEGSGGYQTSAQSRMLPGFLARVLGRVLEGTQAASDRGRVPRVPAFRKVPSVPSAGGVIGGRQTAARGVRSVFVSSDGLDDHTSP